MAWAGWWTRRAARPARHRPAELSGAQRRVAGLRPGRRAGGGFADEPTGNLDSRSGAELLGFLRRSVDELGQTVVMVTHDPVAAGYSDEVVFLADGRVVDRMAAPTAGRVLDAMKARGLTCCATASAACSRPGAAGAHRRRHRARRRRRRRRSCSPTPPGRRPGGLRRPGPKGRRGRPGGPGGEGEVFSDITGELFADPMPASAVDKAARVDGVAAATGVISGDAHLLGDGRVVGGGRAPLGRSSRRLVRPAPARRRLPGGPGEVVIDQRTAATSASASGTGWGWWPPAARSGRSRCPACWTRRRSDAVVWSATTGHRPAAARPGAGPVSYLEVHAAGGVGAEHLTRRCRRPRPGYQAFTGTELAAERAHATPDGAGTPSSSSSPAWSRCSPACS